MFQFPIPEENDLGQFYPASYYSYEDPVTEFEPHGLRHRGVWLTLHYLKWFRSYNHLPVSGNALLAHAGKALIKKPLYFESPRFKPGGSLLDYGSGSGDKVAFFKYLGWKATGIEINSRAAAAGKGAGVQVHQGSIETLERYTECFDYIMSSHCVEHVPDVRRLFRAFFNALRPGECLAIDVPNADALAVERYKECFYYLGMPVHVHIFSPTSICLLAKEVGFMDISVATYSCWYSQAQSVSVCDHASNTPDTRDSGANGSFQSRGCVRGILAHVKAVPAYMLSKRGLRGDCLVMTCKKPMKPLTCR